MKASNNSQNRKTFLQWGALLLSSVAVLNFLPKKKKQNTGKIRMLTESGKLVEIDQASIIGTKRRNITGPELKDWVKNK